MTKEVKLFIVLGLWCCSVCQWACWGLQHKDKLLP